MADPIGRLTNLLPFQHTHTPKKSSDSKWTEKCLIQIYLEGASQRMLSIRPQR